MIYKDSKTLLEVRGLRATVNGVEILKGMDLTVGSGEVHAIMGPNGTGKSTLSNVIAGDDLAASGSAAFVNKNAGTGKTVNLDLLLSGADVGNYQLPSGTVNSTGTVTAKVISAGPVAVTTKLYDGSTVAPRACAAGRLSALGSITTTREDIYGGKIVPFVPFTKLEGDKIVGETPRLKPGEHYSYDSYMLTGDNARATGSFHGVDDLGRRVHVLLPTFEMRVTAFGS